MKMIAPIEVTDAVLTSSNITENDHPQWASGTTYAKGARVIVLSTHTIYESAQGGNTGNDPTTDNGTWWLTVGSTNRWRAFDERIGQSSTRAGTITYTLTLPGICTGVGFLGLNAGSVRVRVSDGSTTIYDQTRDLVDNTEIVNFFTYFTFVPEFSSTAVFIGIPGYTGYTMTITIDAGTGTAEVGEIAVGEFHVLGVTGEGTETGFEDLSIKERDDFGNISVVERAFFDTVSFRVAMPVGSEERVGRIIRRFRAKPALYFADEDLQKRGAVVYGFPLGLRPTLSASGVSFATIEIEGLV